MDTNNLEKRIEVLEKEIESLKNIGSFPSEITGTLLAKGFVQSNISPIIVDAVSYAPQLSQTISLTGAAEDIDVPAYPAAYMLITDGPAIGYYLPVYVFPRTF